MRRILHAGCGGASLPPWPFLAGQEVRLDIDPACCPDVIGSLTDLGEIGAFDTIYCAHCLEHLYPQEVPIALREFLRVLNPGGIAVILVPNLEGVKPSEDVVYHSPAGPVTGLDMFYGMRVLIERSPYMAHHCGFVDQTLEKTMTDAGFSTVKVFKDECFNLIAFGGKSQENN